MKMFLIAAIFGVFVIIGCGTDTDSSDTDINGSDAETSDTETSDIDDTGSVDTNVDTDADTETSSTGVYVAESDETTKDIYELMGSPILNGSKVYMRQYKGLSSGEVAMKVASYDVSGFENDTNLSDLPTNILYEQVGPNYTTAKFNQRYYDIAEVDNNLYFATMPADTETLSQSSFIRYDISSGTETYHVKEDPVAGEHLNTTFDLARGWFIPFDSNQYMGIVEGSTVKVVDVSDGSSYKYGEYDYFGRGTIDTDFIPPAANDTTFFYANNTNLYNVGFLADAGSVSYGMRSTVTDTKYIESNILDDFQEKYTGSTSYYNIEQTSPLVLDGDNIYAFVSLAYKDADDFVMRDLYLLNYDTSSVLKSITYLDGNEEIGSSFDVWETYKYKDTLYFKFRHDLQAELCAYNLNTQTFTFRHLLADHPYVTDIPATTYVITGDTIIMPENIKRADYDPENNSESTFYYDLVFKVLDINDGSELKTVHHKDLNGLRYSDNDVRVRASLSDANAVYFFGLRKNDDSQHNMIIKIDTPSNSVQKTRNRFDSHLTAVVK